MKLSYVAAVCLMCGVLCGCEENMAVDRTKGLDVELVNTVNNVQVENAIIAQRTLYPYHFVADGEELNDLGQRDFGVLAQHFKEHPGVLNIRRGETSADLYEARVGHILSGLKKAGIEVNRMSVADGMPGGPGMPSEQAVTILKEASGRLTTPRQ